MGMQNNHTNSYEIYEDDIDDVEEIQGTDVKINPDYYIHLALVKAQDALVKDNLKDGLVQFRLLVEHMESLCRAAGMINKDYEDSVTTLLTQTTDGTKIATKKIELMMKEVFSLKTINVKLKLDGRKMEHKNPENVPAKLG